MKYQGIIFDLDGTLLDTLADLHSAVNYTLAKLNEPLRSLDEVRNFVGNGVPTLLQRALTDKSKHAKALAIFTPYYHDHKDDTTKPYEGIVELLQVLTDKGYKLGIVSNKIHEATLGLNQNMFKGLIKYVVGAQANLAMKPDGQMLDYCIKMMAIAKTECLYLGDTDVDYATAKNADVDFVAVGWGFRDEHFLKSLKPQYFIKKPLELVKLLESLSDQT